MRTWSSAARRGSGDRVGDGGTRICRARFEQRERPRQRERKPAADRHVECRELRFHRRTGQRALPPPLPRRLLHEARRHQPDRAPCRPQHRRNAGERPRRPHRLHSLQRLRRLQPGRDDPAQGARNRHRRRRPRDGRGADQPHPPVPAPERAGRRDRRDHREALADLGRDRLQCPEPRQRGPRDPSGGQLRLRPPLRRRPARSPECRRRRNRSAGRVPLLPRQRALEAGRDQRPPQAFQGHLQDPAQGRDRPQGPLPGLGLHGRERPEQRRSRARRCGTTPSPSSATRTSPT